MECNFHCRNLVAVDLGWSGRDGGGRPATPEAAAIYNTRTLTGTSFVGGGGVWACTRSGDRDAVSTYERFTGPKLEIASKDA